MNRTTAPIVTARFDQTTRRYKGILLGPGYAAGDSRIETLAELDLVLARLAPDATLATLEADGSLAVGLERELFVERARHIIAGGA